MEIEEGTNVTVVGSIDFYMSEEYITEVFESCKGVIMPSTGGIAMDLACNTQPGENMCTPKKWYSFMGDAENEYVPFPINYKYDDPQRAFAEETKPCSEAYPVSVCFVELQFEEKNARNNKVFDNFQGKVACSCVDCDVSCTSGTVPATPGTGFWRIFLIVLRSISIAALVSLLIAFTFFKLPGT